MHIHHLRLKRVRITTLAVEKHEVLNITIMCLFVSRPPGRTNCIFSALLYRIFTHHLIKRHDFRKRVTEHKCVLNFSTTFVRNISHSEKHSATYKYYKICGYHMHKTKCEAFCTNRSRWAASWLHCSNDTRDVAFSQRCPKDSSLLGCDAVLFGKRFCYFEGL